MKLETFEPGILLQIARQCRVRRKKFIRNCISLVSKTSIRYVIWKLIQTENKIFEHTYAPALKEQRKRGLNN